MTPLIQKMSKLVPNAEKKVWFDVGNMPSEFDYSVDEYLLRPPFNQTAIVFRALGNLEFVLMCYGNDGVAVGVSGLIVDGLRQTMIPPFAYVNTADGIKLTTHDSFKLPPKEHCTKIMGMIAYFLLGLQTTGTTAYQATAIESHINRVRAKKGKAPLFVTWNTVVVAPSKPHGESKGGTHASPRKHDRRGHWRQYANGNRVWVRQAVVGNAAKGLVMKDYIVRAAL